jgi:hypothetical protein
MWSANMSFKLPGKKLISLLPIVRQSIHLASLPRHDSADVLLK